MSGGPGLAEAGRLAALLAHLARGRPSPGMRRRIAEERDVKVDSEVVVDRYQPRAPIRTRLVLVHGVTVNGKDDKHLVHLARSLAAVGASCVVPRLPALAELRLSPMDLDHLERVLAAESRDRSVGVVGFSFGASYGLVAAGRPSVRERVAFCLAFGACHSFAALAEELEEGPSTWTDPTAADSWVYLHMVLAWRHRAILGLPSGVEEELNQWLRSFCSRKDLAAKVRFFEEHLRDLDLLRLDREQRDDGGLRALSPAGQLGSLGCPVGLLHDPGDTMVPLDHALHLAAELEANGCPHRLLVTPMISHVKLATVLGVRDWWRLAVILAPLVRVNGEAA